MPSHSSIRDYNLHVQDDEHILLVVRKHWLVLKLAMLPVVLVGFFGFVFIQALIGNASDALGAFINSLWLLGTWMLLFTIWTNYFLDTWVITDKRIIDIDQRTLFNRAVSTIRVERIQDARVEVNGFLPTLFGYGNLRIQTAGADDEFIFIDGIPEPERVKNVIMEYVDRSTDHLNKLEYSPDKNPATSC
jgi:uncharacterized membrane protein YdbT with pleckstrin-like domain